jgi:hypothetical protein
MAQRPWAINCTRREEGLRGGPASRPRGRRARRGEARGKKANALTPEGGA